MSKPLFADNWYGKLPADEVRKEVQSVYDAVQALETAEVAFDDLTDVPSVFPPESHTHVEADITDLGSYLPLAGGTLTGSTLIKSGSDYKSFSVRRDDQSGVGQEDRVMLDIVTGVGAARLSHYNGDTLAISNSLELRRGGRAHFDGAGVTITADVTEQFVVRSDAAHNQLQLLSALSAPSNESYIRNATSDGTVDGSIIIQGGDDTLRFRPGDTSGTRHVVWHDGNLSYETGNWTPTISSGFGSFTYSTQSGQYKLVGDTLILWGRVSGTGATPNSDTLRIGGLPMNIHAGHSVGVIGMHSGFRTTAANPVPGLFSAATSFAVYRSGPAATWSVMTGTSQGTNYFDLIFTATCRLP